ncbi:phosphate propanoyltransferase [Cellulosilyticum sp. I15G10I2]|uniref:phosphate propanoyltransferase n=1 Tax=Cellulosilyticum sp. I15G10I2 TaxID=1892843 RepID=UPI00085CAD55|nr:phosphate propanoyltransferase [Cellulosilyticum sp. I15G10I2]
MNIQEVAGYVKEALTAERLVQIEISARHIHLSQKDVEKLFGQDYQLQAVKPLSQPGQYLCKERVSIVSQKGRFEKVAVLGPIRDKTQIEISKTDTFVLGINPPIRESGDLSGTPGIQIIGPCGTTEISEGVIIAKRHIHITPKEAKQLLLDDKQCVWVELLSKRPVVFKDVVVRISENYSFRMHIDADEANAGDVGSFTLGKIIG